MSRIRGIRIGILKKRREPEIENRTEKDDVERNQIRDLLENLPKLGKTFEVHRKIGEGTFSTVYLGTMRQHSGAQDSEKKWYAIKHLVPTTHPSRVVHELRCLRDIGGVNHVIGVELCLRNLDNVVFVMPYIPHRKFSEYVGDMDAEELRRYMRALLTALRHVHTFGVIHRDVKPSNFLYDRENRRYALVDFGLAQHTKPTIEPSQPPPAHQSLKRPRHSDFREAPGAKRLALDLSMRTRAQEPPPRPVAIQLSVNDGIRRNHMSPPPAHSRPAADTCACAGLAGVCAVCAVWAPPRANRSGTQGFRPPEVLFKYADQTTAVDMWASGVVLASVLSGRYPFFRAADDMSALAEITSFAGTDKMHGAAAALDRRLVTSTTLSGVCLRRLSQHLRGSRSGSQPAPAPPGAPLPPGTCAACRLPQLNCFCLDSRFPSHVIHPARTYAGFPDSAFALAARLLEPNPRERITAAEALRHPFLQP